jgi:hypothetical protein
MGNPPPVEVLQQMISMAASVNNIPNSSWVSTTAQTGSSWRPVSELQNHVYGQPLAERDRDEVEDDFDSGDEDDFDEEPRNPPHPSEEKDSDAEDESHFVAKKTSPTRDMTTEQFLDNICKFVDGIMAMDPKLPYSGFGPHVSYSKNPSGSERAVDISNIIFEVNQVTVAGVIITQEANKRPGHLPDEPFEYNVILKYVVDRKDYSHGSKYNIRVNGTNLREVMSQVHAKLLKMKKCCHCSSVYDTNISDVCIICLFSDYFTKDNPVITCIICREKIKDFATLGCQHRFCLPCLFKITNHKCPTCRATFTFSGNNNRYG